MKIIVNNLAVQYKEEGNGRVILLLHGWMQNLHTFDSLAPALSARFRIIRLDLPGFGGSEFPEEPWTVGDYASFASEFCRKLNIHPYALIGHSFGGRVIIKGVAEGFFEPEKAVLIASAGLARHKKPKTLLFLMAAKVGKLALFFLPSSIKEKLRNKLYGAAGSFDYVGLKNRLLKQTFLKAVREDLSDDAKHISIPTMLIWGKDDTETPLSDGKILRNLIPGSRMKILENSGHFVHEEKSTEVAGYIMDFLK